MLCLFRSEINECVPNWFCCTVNNEAILHIVHPQDVCVKNAAGLNSCPICAPDPAWVTQTHAQQAKQLKCLLFYFLIYLDNILYLPSYIFE